VEDNTTSFLVRSTRAAWKRGSVLAVDAGVHLSAIVRMMEKHYSDYKIEHTNRPVTLESGPFKGLEIPHVLAKSNAAHITRTLIGTYLITHPHLDHISGFVVNTALSGSRPKVLAGLPSTIEAFKTHIFNNVIWPNLSDENNGAGLVTYKRLVDGGSPALGEGEDKGYMEICEGLSVKTWSVSHGHCIERHSHRGSNVSAASPPSSYELSPQARSRTSSQFQAPALPGRSTSIGSLLGDDLRRAEPSEHICVYDSSVYFIRDVATGREVLIFGDVEPDSISLSPRNKHIWSEAAPKIISGRLGGIFIECSFDNSISDDRLYGHLASRYLNEELKVLASEVDYYKTNEHERAASRKRKRYSGQEDGPRRASTRSSRASPTSPLPRTHHPSIASTQSSGTEDRTGRPKSADSKLPLRGKGDKTDLPLKGVKIVIIHVKDNFDDGPEVGDVILNELKQYEEEEPTGCEFVIAKAGEAVYL
jgi:cAMP phosphodiesterase